MKIKYEFPESVQAANDGGVITSITMTDLTMKMEELAAKTVRGTNSQTASMMALGYAFAKFAICGCDEKNIPQGGEESELLWARLSAKQRELIVQAFTKDFRASEEEAEDFFGSKAVIQD